MGRPRKRRREAEPSGQAAEPELEDPSVLAVPSHSDVSLVPPNLDDFSTFVGLQAHDVSDGMLSTPFSKAPLSDDFSQGAILDLE